MPYAPTSTRQEEMTLPGGCSWSRSHTWSHCTRRAARCTPSKAEPVDSPASGRPVPPCDVGACAQRRFLSLAPGANVVLAASAVETTRLALQSFPTALMGRNLMAHVRSDFTVRVRRSALPSVPGHVQTTA